MLAALRAARRDNITQNGNGARGVFEPRGERR
jgi:hypothetical protein